MIRKRLLAGALVGLLGLMAPAESVLAASMEGAQNVISVEMTEETVQEETVSEASQEAVVQEETVTEETVTEEPAADETVQAPVTDETVTEKTETTETEKQDPETDPVVTEDEFETEESAPVQENKSGTMQADVAVKAVGSNGIQYDGVAYLSLNVVDNMSSDAQTVYYQMCDEISAMYEQGYEIIDPVISVDKNGQLEMSVSFPTNLLYTEGVQAQFTEGEQDSAVTKEEVSENTEASEETVEAPEETVTEEEIAPPTEEPEQTVDTPEQTNPAEEVTEGEVQDPESDKEMPSEDDISEPSEELTPAESEDVITSEEIPEETEGVIGIAIPDSENMELAEACNIPIEDADESAYVINNTLMLNESYFRNQLDSYEKALFDAGKSAMVNGTKTGFNYSTYAWLGSMSYYVNAISALINTYPNRFNWMDLGYNGNTQVKYRYRSGKYTYSISITKSKHYKSSLEKEADKVVNDLVAQANEFAAVHYPGCPTYGMVSFFDDWICRFNYYNYVGTFQDKESMSSSTYFYCHSAFGILLKGYGVCESYALAMSRLLDAAGIRNIYVTGKTSGGGHAWNYVCMPDGQWYQVDSTWNDTDYASNPSSGEYLLVGSNKVGSSHTPQGTRYVIGRSFSYPSLSAKNYGYNATAEKTTLSQISLNRTTVAGKTGSTVQLSVTTPSVQNNYYEKYVKNWSSSDPSVAKVDQNGKVTLGKKPGSAVITMTMAGQTRTCTVYAYQFTGLKFADDGKTSKSYTYANPSKTVFNGTINVPINVEQKNPQITAYNIWLKSSLAAPTVKTSKASVATASVSLSGNQLLLKVYPKGAGSTSITVSFADKKVTYKLTVKYAMNTSWFSVNTATVAYSGKAYKPVVAKSYSAPSDLKYKVTYLDNKNAGKATIKISGSGVYAGDLYYYFTITPDNIQYADFVSCTANKTYSGTNQTPSVKVKHGSKTLKMGTDFDLLYNGSTTAPKTTGTYTVTVRGKGNYTGTLIEKKTFVIDPISSKKVSVSCSSKIKYTGGIANPVKVKIGKCYLTEGTDYIVTYYSDTNGAKVNPIYRGSYRAVITFISRNIDMSNGLTTVDKKFVIQ